MPPKAEPGHSAVPGDARPALVRTPLASQGHVPPTESSRADAGAPSMVNTLHGPHSRD